MTASKQVLCKWRDDLGSADSSNCHFRHHPKDPEKPDLPLCATAIQNRLHGCAHAANYLVQAVLKEMRNANFLEPSVANSFEIRINQQHVLTRLDHRVAIEMLDEHEYDSVDGSHNEVIRKREVVTQELLALVNDTLAHFPATSNN